MPATYEPIATTTLGSAASSIEFSNISGSYTDLRLVFVGSGSGTGVTGLLLRFNSDTGTNYSCTALYGDGASALSLRATGNTRINLVGELSYNLSKTTPVLVTADIFSYAGSTNKTVLYTESQDLNGTGEIGSSVGLWRNTAAITTITLSVAATMNLAAGTTATLYGILKA